MNRLTMERLRPIRDEVYLSIRKAILRGQYKPGERLQEEELSAKLGTSRTPVREALRKLEVEKIAVHYPHRGTVVADLPLSEVDDLYEIRKYVEVVIARRAAEMATDADIKLLESMMEREEAANDPYEIMDCIDDYNAALAMAAKSPAIADICMKVRETLGRMIVYGHTRPERRVLAQQEHRAIVAAIAAHDADLAGELTRTHIENGSITADMYLDHAKPNHERGKKGYLYGDWAIADRT